MIYKTMSDGTIAFGPECALIEFDKVIKNQMNIDTKAKFKPNEKVKLKATKDELIKYFEDTGDTTLEAKQQAVLLLSEDYGIIIGKTICPEGDFYTLEYDTIPMIFLPEKFLSKR